MIAPD